MYDTYAVFNVKLLSAELRLSPITHAPTP